MNAPPPPTLPPDVRQTCELGRRINVLERERGLAFDSHPEGDCYLHEQLGSDVLVLNGTGVW